MWVFIIKSQVSTKYLVTILHYFYLYLINHRYSRDPQKSGGQKIDKLYTYSIQMPDLVQTKLRPCQGAAVHFYRSLQKLSTDY